MFGGDQKKLFCWGGVQFFFAVNKKFEGFKKNLGGVNFFFVEGGIMIIFFFGGGGGFFFLMGGKD